VLGSRVAVDYYGSGDATNLGPFGTPVFFRRWKGKVSSYYPIGLYPLDIIFGRPFYFSPRAAYWNWGMQWYNLPPGIDNTNWSWGCGGF
jgi:hypothetical protein